MRYYRDLEPDEPLQAGDEILADPPQWVPVNPSLFGLSPAARSLPEYRRPVDAVPREEHERLQDVLAEVRYLHGQAMHDRDTLQSQPRLQPVTPEAMAELEQSEWVGIIHTCEYYTAVKGWDGKQWYDEATGNNVDRPTGGWFIELEKLKEGQL